MLKAAAERGWLDERRAVLETLTGIRRAGADLVITYYATEGRALAGGRRVTRGTGPVASASPRHRRGGAAFPARESWPRPSPTCPLPHAHSVKPPPRRAPDPRTTAAAYSSFQPTLKMALDLQPRRPPGRPPPPAGGRGRRPQPGRARQDRRRRAPVARPPPVRPTPRLHRLPRRRPAGGRRRAGRRRAASCTRAPRTRAASPWRCSTRTPRSSSRTAGRSTPRPPFAGLTPAPGADHAGADVLDRLRAGPDRRARRQAGPDHDRPDVAVGRLVPAPAVAAGSSASAARSSAGC